MTGWTPLDWVLAAAAFTTAVGVIWRAGVLPITRAVNRLVDAVAAVEAHAVQLEEGEAHFRRTDERLAVMGARQSAMADQLETVCVAITPTNGDKRTLSDRVDTIGDTVAAHAAFDDERFAADDRRLAAIERAVKGRKP